MVQLELAKIVLQLVIVIQYELLFIQAMIFIDASQKMDDDMNGIV